jgi:hypothetical protein
MGELCGGIDMITWIYNLTEEGLARLLAFLLASERSTGVVSGGARKAADIGDTIERSMHRLLGVLNLPSRTDYNKLLSKVEILQGSLMNLNIKVDRLLAARERPRREPPDGHGAVE